MSIKTDVDTIIVEPRTEELPTTCPNCGADLVAEEGSGKHTILEVAYVAETRRCRLLPGLVFDYEDSEIESFPEAEIITGYECAACLHPLVKERILRRTYEL